MILPALMLALSISALDQQIVNTALPRIVSELGGLSQLSWVVTAFMLTQTITMPLYGKLSDLYGRRAMFLVCISVFLLGSALCGAAQSMLQLILFRGLQGLGAGGIYTLVSTTIGDFVTPRERARYQGYFTAVFVICTVAGPVVGGLLTSAFSWRAVFWVNLPLGAIVLVVLGLALPASARVRHKVDYAGAVLIGAATTPLLLALSWGGTKAPWASPLILGLGGLAMFGFVVLIAHERRAAEPILSVHLVHNKAFLWGVISCGLVGFAFYGSNVFLPLYFQVVRGLPPAEAGLMVLPQILGNLLASVVGGQLISRTGRYKECLVGGAVMLTLSYLLLAWLIAREGALWQLEACQLVLGLGGNLSFLSLTVAVQNAVGKRDLGMATSSMTFLNSLLGAAGVALFGAILAGRLTAYLDLHGATSHVAADLVHALGAAPAISPVVAGAYRYAISRAFLVSALLNIATVLAVLRVPQKHVRAEAVA